MRIPVIVPAVELDFDPQPLPPQSVESRMQSPSAPTRAMVAPRNTSIGERILNRSSQVSNAPSGSSEIATSLARIQETTEGIVNGLNQRERAQKELEEERRKKEESKRRRKAEALLEGSAKKVSDSFKKTFAPIQGMWGSIIKFITNIILGKALLKLLQWFSDPNNKDKVKSLFRFFKDYWPAIIGTFVLFGTSFGKFIRSTVGFIINLSKFIAKNGMKGLRNIAISLGKRTLVGALVVGGTAAGLYGASQLLKPKDEEETIPTKPIQARAGGGKIKPINFIVPEKRHINDLKYENGGFITDDSGLQITGAGVDTQLIAARPGEIVISKEAVDKYGSDFFLKINKAGGGTNRPKMVNNIQLASGGGEIGSSSSSGGGGITSAVNIALPKIKHEEALSSLTKGANDYVKSNKTSTISRTPWSKITSKTPIHAYLDSGGLPTIGWGATFYDSLLSGNKKVKMGDTISKERADNLINFHVTDLANAYSKSVPNWNKMSNNQRAGVLLTGYHRPYSMLGAYPDYSKSLSSGNMKSLANDIVRRAETPSDRLNMQRSLILSGPLDLNVTQPKPKEKPKSKGFFERTKDFFMRFTGLKKAEMPEISPSDSGLGTLNSQISFTQIPNISPLGKVERTTRFIQLPPITLGSGAKQTAIPGNSDVPDLTAISPFSSERLYNAKAYGLG